MAKILCSSIECKHNSENQCRAKSINLSVGYVHTLHQGYMQHWICRTYEQSEEAKKIQEVINRFYGREKEGSIDG